MTQEPIPQAPDEERRAWSLLASPGSPIKAALHNEIVKRIRAKISEFEEATLSDIPRLQAEVKALRFLFGVIHRNEKLPTK